MLMKIVIKIDDELYNEILSRKYSKTRIEKAVANGIPLPEHHGRLIDGDKVLDEIEKQYPASVSETDKRKRYARLVYYWAVKNAPTIIEAEVSE
jgi:hypothetical protein